jgi:anti-anti-sigma factor
MKGAGMSNALLATQETDGALLATVQRDTILETLQVEQFEREMQTLVEGKPGRHLIIDMAQVELLCSASIGVLVNQYRRLQTGGSRFVLCSVQPSVQRLLNVTRLDQMFAIYPDTATAQRELAAAGTC